MSSLDLKLLEMFLSLTDEQQKFVLECMKNMREDEKDEVQNM